jgi:hypothetical protein
MTVNTGLHLSSDTSFHVLVGGTLEAGWKMTFQTRIKQSEISHSPPASQSGHDAAIRRLHRKQIQFILPEAIAEAREKEVDASAAADGVGDIVIQHFEASAEFDAGSIGALKV